MKTILLFLNGEVSLIPKKISVPSYDTVVVAVDGGANAARKFGFEPDFLVGDFDSIEIEHFPTSKKILLKDQSMGDFEKSLLFCEKQFTYCNIIVLGMFGGRDDHFINNLSVAFRYINRFNFSFFSDYSRLLLLQDSLSCEVEIGTVLSFFPFFEAFDVVTRGLKYAINSQDMIFGRNESLSNVALNSKISIEFSTGALVVFINY